MVLYEKHTRWGHCPLIFDPHPYGVPYRGATISRVTSRLLSYGMCTISPGSADPCLSRRDVNTHVQWPLLWPHGSKNRYENGLVCGNMGQNLPNPSSFILSHTHFSYAALWMDESHFALLGNQGKPWWVGILQGNCDTRISSILQYQRHRRKAQPAPGSDIHTQEHVSPDMVRLFTSALKEHTEAFKIAFAQRASTYFVVLHHIIPFGR